MQDEDAPRSPGELKKSDYAVIPASVPGNVEIDLERAGNKPATEILEHFFEDFGLAMSTLINILDPDQIVLGGGVSNINELYTIGIE